jgi:hypothetical protein
MLTKLNTLVGRLTRCGGSAAWRGYRWRFGCFSFVLEHNLDRNDISRHWYDELAFDTWVVWLFSPWLRESFLPVQVNESTESSETDEDDRL